MRKITLYTVIAAIVFSGFARSACAAAVNLARAATVATDIPLDAGEMRLSKMENINDNEKTWWIWATPQGIDYEGRFIEFEFPQKSSVSSVAISTDGVLGPIEGLKNIDILAYDGANWAPVMEGVALTWTGVATGGAETLTIPFATAVETQKIKIIINQIMNAYGLNKFRIAEIELFGEALAVPDPGHPNIAAQAEISTDIQRDQSDPRFWKSENLTDGEKTWWIWVTNANYDYLDRYIQFVFDREMQISKLTVSTDGALGPVQGIKAVDIYVRDGGAWNLTRENVRLLWTGSAPEGYETLHIILDDWVVTDGIKFVIKDIYSTAEKKFRVAEIGVHGIDGAPDTEPPHDPNDPNIAPSGQISTDIVRDEAEPRFSSTGNLTDGDKNWTLWVTPAAAAFTERFIQFDFDRETTVSKVALFTDEGLGAMQGIRKLSIYAAGTPGGAWAPVKNDWVLSWSNLSPYEAKTLLFDRPVALRSIRFVIQDIYDASEKKFRVSEVEIYGKSTGYEAAVANWERTQSGGAKDYLALRAEIEGLFDGDFKTGLLSRLQAVAGALEAKLPALAAADNYLRIITVTAETVLHAGASLAADIAGPGGFSGQVSFQADGAGKIHFEYPLPQDAPYGEYTFTFAGKRAAAAYSAPKTDAELLSFTLDGAAAKINGGNVSVTLPYQTDVSSLAAAFTLSANASLYNGGLLLVSGITKCSYAAPVTLTVMAEDKTARNYTVTVSVEEKAGPTYSGGGGGGGSKSVYLPITAEQPPEETAPAPPKTYDYTGHWAQGLFEKLIEKGVIAPDENGNVEPDRAVKREEVTKMMVLMMGLAPVETASETFRDVSQDAWYNGYVAAAVQKGLIRGVGEGLFGSGQSLSRQDAAVMIYRALGLSPSGTQGVRDIGRASEYAREALETLYEKGIMKGDGQGTLRPADTVTRAEAAAMLDRIL